MKILKSFIPLDSSGDFSIHNLPYGVFSENENPTKKIGVAIGDYILDLSILFEENLLSHPSISFNVFASDYLNNFMEQGKQAWDYVRKRVQSLLDVNNNEIQHNQELKQKVLIKMANCKLHLPVKTTDYTDFYASKHHAFNVGSMFRGPENALMPNWLYLPVGYHGRASSIIVSGVNIHRPKGQTKPKNLDKPIFGPSRRLDFEFEMGFFVGQPNPLGEPIPIDQAEDHIFGMVIVNDWSARDIQGWEYQPLGPFLAKNFATSISPWVVPLDALREFEIDLPSQDPEPLDYLFEPVRKSYDIKLEVAIQTKKMDTPQVIMHSNFKYLYWTISQMLAHHSVTGCNMNVGDLLASGTISGPNKENRACMLELSWAGKEPLTLENGETRSFLEDDDLIIMRAYCEKDGVRVGFGEVVTKILPCKNIE